MVNTKLYQRKSQVRFFLAMYALLALAGGGTAAWLIRNNQSGSNAVGFMLAFGIGMFILTLVRSRKPQVLVYEDFLEVNQGRAVQTVRYRNMTAVSRPDRSRLVVTLNEEGGSRNVVIWLRELESDDVERLFAFLQKRKGKRK